MSVMGVDWASGVWIVAVADENVTVRAEPSFLNIVERYDPAVLLVDIPVHLDEESGFRTCDERARERDGVAASVFRVPSIDAVESETYVEGLGSTCWSLVFQIREVRTVIESEVETPYIVESHPEVCFHGIDGESVRASKHDKQGLTTRIDALASSGEGGERYRNEFERIQSRAEDGTAWQHRIGTGRLDDVLDAMSMARAAELSREGDHFDLDVVPESVGEDEIGSQELDTVTPHIAFHDAD